MGLLHLAMEWHGHITVRKECSGLLKGKFDTTFIMHLDLYYVKIYSKNNVSRKKIKIS